MNLTEAYDGLRDRVCRQEEELRASRRRTEALEKALDRIEDLVRGVLSADEVEDLLHYREQLWKWLDERVEGSGTRG